MYSVRKKPARKAPRGKIAFQRVPAEIQVDSTKEVLDSRVFLMDLSPAGVGLFTNDFIEKNEKVNIVIEHPKHLFVRGRVIYCTPYTLDTKIISAETFSYRVGVQFIFETPEEKDSVNKYCEEVLAQAQAQV